MQRVLVAALLFLALLAPTAEAASPDENARVLAGLPVAAASPLAPLEQTRAWQTHAEALNAAFGRVEARQLSKIRAWSKANLTVRKPTLFYFFSGPDFLYANAFFPDESTYVMAGLEPPGPIPDLTKLSKNALPGELRALQVSMRSLLNVSFFKTLDMDSDLRTSPMRGTIPLLYTFLARSGKTVADITLLQLDEDGTVKPVEEQKGKGSKGVKITFWTPGGPAQTLYYFSTNLADGGFAKSGFEKFCDQFGEGSAFIKSASYLLHGYDFSQARRFLLKHDASILQDDTGIPVTMFGPDWQLKPYGRYRGPIGMFARAYQPKLDALFRKTGHASIDFGVGYRWQPNESNLLLAIKHETSAAH